MFKPIHTKPTATAIDRSISVAPMMDWTTRHCRYFHRLLSPHALLYTEMVTTGALIHGDVARHLAFDSQEHPVALQLGGSNPADLAQCAELATQWGYDEINLNCGCPSDRVQSGRFGACLMNEPDSVAECVYAMQQRTHLPVTVKCRIGVDDCDDVPFLDQFIRTVRDAGCRVFIIHARKAWLKGLSPKENRDIPPLRYDIAADIKTKYPDLTVILNGGIKTLDQAKTVRDQFDGVMIGREAYENPFFLTELEHDLYGTPLPDRDDVARAMGTYLASMRLINPDMPINSVTRHMLGLYRGMNGARAWRRILTEGSQQPTTVGADLIDQALIAVTTASAQNA